MAHKWMKHLRITPEGEELRVTDRMQEVTPQVAGNFTSDDKGVGSGLVHVTR